MFFTVDDDSEVAIAPRFSGTDVLKKFRWLIEDLEAKKLYFWGKRGPTEIQIFCQNFRILFFLSRIESKLQHWCFWVRSTPTSANILFYGKNALSHSLSLSLFLSHIPSLSFCLSLSPSISNTFLHEEEELPSGSWTRLVIFPLFPAVAADALKNSSSLSSSPSHSLTHSLTHNLTYFCWVYSIGLRAMNGSWREPDSWKLTRSGVRKTLSLRHPTPLSLPPLSLTHTLSLSHVLFLVFRVFNCRRWESEENEKGSERAWKRRRLLRTSLSAENYNQRLRLICLPLSLFSVFLLLLFAKFFSLSSSPL